MNKAQQKQYQSLYQRHVDAQRELGHASPKTTAIYTQLTDKVEQDVTRLINTMVGRLSITSAGRAA